jgi:hypothetical protein
MGMKVPEAGYVVDFVAEEARARAWARVEKQVKAVEKTLKIDLLRQRCLEEQDLEPHQ